MRGVIRLASLGWRRGQRGAAALMLVVIALAAAALTAAASVAGGAGHRIDQAFRQGRGPELVVYTAPGDAAQVSAALANDVDVTGLSTPVPARPADLQIDGGAAAIEQRVMALPDTKATGDVARSTDTASLGQPVVRTGRLPGADDELALDAGVALRFGIATGDRVTLSGQGGTPVEFRVAGTAYDFTDCFYPQCDPGRSWVTPAGQARLGPPTGTVISVSLTAPDRADAVEQRLGLAVSEERFDANSWLDTRGDLLTESNFFAAFLRAFGIFTLVASGIVIAAGTTARAVANRRRTGICKAVGATPGQLVTGQVVEHAVIGALAAVLGWVGAALITPRLQVGSLRVVGSEGVTLRLPTLLVTVAVILVIVVAVTLVPAWRASREPAVDAVRDAPRESGRSRLGDATAAAGAPVAVEWGLRSLTARPFRAVTAVAASALAVVAAVVSLSMNSTIDYLLAHPALTGDPWDVSLTPSGASTPTEAAARLSELPEVASWYTVRDETATWQHGKVHVRVLGGDPAAAHYAIGAGRMASSAGEAIVAYGLVNDNGVKIGDTITLHAAGRALPVTVVGWYRDTEDTGRIIQIRDSTQAPLFPGEAATYAVTATPGVDAAELAGALRTIGGEVRINRQDDTAFAPFRTAMAAMTALLAAVAIAHLLATALATARERAKGTAILRTIGASARQTVGAAAVAGAVTALGAVLIGLPLGLWLQQVLGAAITSSIGVGPGAGAGLPGIATLLVIVAVVAIGVGAVVAATFRTARQPIAAVLAAE